MFIDYKNAIVCGVIAGIFIGLSQFLTCCCWPVDVVLLLGAGAVVIYLSRGRIVEQNDVLANGAITGLIAGGLGGVLYAIFTVLTQVIAQAMNFDYSTICGTSYHPPTLLEASAMGFVCCLPAIVVAGVVLGALGALLYTMVMKRKQPEGGSS